MEKNYSSTNRSAAFDRDLSLPHFDEEATLLSARPVVPLQEVEAKPRFMPRVIFGFVVLAAILVGAISATLLLRTEQTSQRAAESEVKQPTAWGAAGGSTSEPALARVPAARDPEEEPKLREVPIVRTSSTKRGQTAAISHSATKPSISRSSSKPARAGSSDYERAKDFENEERELRRAERRDARREARRQQRNRRERMGDDVLRIREIFEGSPRP